MSHDVTLKVDGLDQLIKALKKTPVVRVGILGDHEAREAMEGEKTALTNAEVGAIYEFNTDPNRAGGSFLRMPIAERLNKALSDSGAFDKKTMKKVIESGTIVPWLEKVGVCAETCIQAAFDTNGFGKWKRSNMDRKKIKLTLVESQQLRKSITSKVVG